MIRTRREPGDGGGLTPQTGANPNPRTPLTPTEKNSAGTPSLPTRLAHGERRRIRGKVTNSRQCREWVSPNIFVRTSIMGFFGSPLPVTTW